MSPIESLIEKGLIASDGSGLTELGTQIAEALIAAEQERIEQQKGQ